MDLISLQRTLTKILEGKRCHNKSVLIISVYVVFQDVLLDSNSTANFLTNTLQVAPDVTDALLESLIDVNVVCAN